MTKCSQLIPLVFTHGLEAPAIWSAFLGEGSTDPALMVGTPRVTRGSHFITRHWGVQVETSESQNYWHWSSDDISDHRDHRNHPVLQQISTKQSEVILHHNCNEYKGVLSSCQTSAGSWWSIPEIRIPPTFPLGDQGHWNTTAAINLWGQVPHQQCLGWVVAKQIPRPKSCAHQFNSQSLQYSNTSRTSLRR